MAFVQTVAPAAEPLTLAEAKAHLRVDGTDEDTLITALIVAAREQAEAFLRRALITQTWRLDADRFAAMMALAYPPIVSVSSVTYTDIDGNSQTVATSVYELDAAEAIVRLKYNQTWPSARDHPDAVKITYVAGYGAAGSNVPASIRQGMLMLIGHMFENRELSAPILINQVPMATKHLWMPFRWMTF